MAVDSRIVCPYCQHECCSDGVSDDKTIICDKCKMAFKCYMEMVAEYTTEKDCVINGDEHDWQASMHIFSSQWLFFDCNKCGAIKSEDKE